MKKRKRLRIWDFDDCLVFTDSHIYVTHKDGSTTKLSSAEYSKYKKSDGDTFDYSEFDGPLLNPKLHKRNFNLLKRIYKTRHEHKRIVILTARGKSSPILKFLRSHKFNDVIIIPLGDSNPKRKAEWIESQIEDGFMNICYIDDSIHNIKAVELLKKKYNKLHLKTKLVK